MLVKIWGVRGSIPTPGPKTIRYGGNTSCIEVRAGDQLIIVDAGTGIRELGNSLLREYKGKPIHASILLTHTHWDHIHGFPFFVPAYIPCNDFVIYGPVSFDERLEDIMSNQMKYSYFPVKLSNMQAKKEFRELQEGEFTIGDVTVRTQYLNHPILTLGYRIEHCGKVFAVITDTEPYYNVFGTDADGNGAPSSEEIGAIVEDLNSRVEQFIRGADLVAYDSQYTESEYSAKVGWGHSTYEGVTAICLKAGVKQVLYFHHDPERSDEALDAIVEAKQKELEGGPMTVSAAAEGLEITL